MNNNPMIAKVTRLAEQIELSIPNAEVQTTVFPSGAAMLDVRRAGRLYVLAYSPSRHFGVDEVCDGEGFQIGYRFTSAAFEPAAEHLLRLVASASAGPPVLDRESFQKLHATEKG